MYIIYGLLTKNQPNKTTYFLNHPEWLDNKTPDLIDVNEHAQT